MAVRRRARGIPRVLPGGRGHAARTRVDTADIVGRYGESSEVPAALTEYIKGREGYDYNQHGQAGNIHADFVPDEIVDRFCILGPVDEQVRRINELRNLGVDQFAVYLQHDAKDETLQAYGEHVIPAITEHTLAKT